jgi:diacylglycerol kinase (ATP)
MHRRSLLLSFRDAFAGISYVFRGQRNFKIQCLTGAAALALGVILRLSHWDMAVVVLCVAVVLASEMANTAIETIVDVLSPGPSEGARLAKDVAAGAVLVAATGAVAMGLLIFVPPLWELIR